ncbi:MAG TPA: VOC family protein [Acidimicrobiia bacterium]|nr:VOC family protein [Acidimicrobiia bacterium]
MTVQLNHTIVWCRDQKVSADFLVDILGLDPPTAWGPFLDVDMVNGVTLAYHETDEAIVSQHYAFLVGEDEFDHGFGRVRDRGLDYWADPALSQRGAINHHDGGRGVYFFDPDGHLLELITRPYGSA